MVKHNSIKNAFGQQPVLLSLALAAILGIGLASWAAYRYARAELETSKRKRLVQDAGMLARQTEAWLQKSKANMVLWAEMPIVRQVAVKPGDPVAVTAAACIFFSVSWRPPASIRPLIW